MNNLSDLIVKINTERKKIIKELFSYINENSEEEIDIDRFKNFISDSLKDFIKFDDLPYFDLVNGERDYFIPFGMEDYYSFISSSALISCLMEGIEYNSFLILTADHFKEKIEYGDYSLSIDDDLYSYLKELNKYIKSKYIDMYLDLNKKTYDELMDYFYKDEEDYSPDIFNELLSNYIDGITSGMEKDIDKFAKRNPVFAEYLDSYIFLLGLYDYDLDNIFDNLLNYEVYPYIEDESHSKLFDRIINVHATIGKDKLFGVILPDIFEMDTYNDKFLTQVFIPNVFKILTYSDIDDLKYRRNLDTLEHIVEKNPKYGTYFLLLMC